MFLGLLNTIFLNISNCLPHFELRNRSILTVVITNFVIISNVSIKRADYISISMRTSLICNVRKKIPYAIKNIKSLE